MANSGIRFGIDGGKIKAEMDGFTDAEIAAWEKLLEGSEDNGEA